MLIYMSGTSYRLNEAEKIIQRIKNNLYIFVASLKVVYFSIGKWSLFQLLFTLMYKTLREFQKGCDNAYCSALNVYIKPSFHVHINIKE